MEFFWATLIADSLLSMANILSAIFSIEAVILVYQLFQDKLYVERENQYSAPSQYDSTLLKRCVGTFKREANLPPV